MRVEGHEVAEGLHVQDEGGLTAGLIHTDRGGWRVDCAGAMKAAVGECAVGRMPCFWHGGHRSNAPA